MSTLYTLADLENELKLSKSTLLRLITKQELRPIKVGRSLRFTQDEITRFVASREAEAAAAR